VSNIYKFILGLFLVFSMFGCNGVKETPKVEVKPKIQDVQVFRSKNDDGKITPRSIEREFDKIGLSVPGNNDMNKPFKTRFGSVHYKTYNLAMFINNELTYKLLKKSPKFGALTPLTMSIWQDKDGYINVSTLSINGLSRASGIPVDDVDLVAYSVLVKKGLHMAMPNGEFKVLNYDTPDRNKTFGMSFVAEIDIADDENMEDFIDDFEAEFEGELEPLGFLLPNYTNVQEEIFDDYGYKDKYDFYHTYSICKFDVIYPVSKLHPEAGAWAPCSFYLYKNKGESKIHMGFLGVDNWIKSLEIKDKESMIPLKEAQGMIVDAIKDIAD